MAGWFEHMVAGMAARRTVWRRARNMRAAAAAAPGRAGRRRRAVQAVAWRAQARRALPVLAWLVPALAGCALIAAHARQLGATVPAADAPGGVELFQPLLPGQAFTIGPDAGLTLIPTPAGTLVVANGMKAGEPARVDLCRQAAGDGTARLLPVRIAHPFARIARLAGEKGKAVRGVLLAASPDVPPVTVVGTPDALSVRWPGSSARWVGDAQGGAIVGRGSAALGSEGWLAWEGGALRITRTRSRTCAAGELSVVLLRPQQGPASRALVAAYSPRGAASGWFGPGSYRIPDAPPPRLEDETLFRELAVRHMLRTGADGLVELAPRDLALWRAAPSAARAADLARWSAVPDDEAAHQLLARLYRMADGDYVRRQVALFNSERQLLAWRTAAEGRALRWRGDAPVAAVGSVAVPVTRSMPPVASTLFDELPQGWAPWTRIASWPQGGGRRAQVSFVLDGPARAGQTMALMLAGRVLGVDGARVLASAPACSGRACPDAGAVRRLALALEPGARQVVIHAEPVALPAPGPGDLRYRHLLAGGSALEWRPAVRGARVAAPADSRAVRLEDRNGVPLLAGGWPTAPAARAGLAALVGVHPQHANSVAGMLARIPGPPGHSARLAIDTGLQAAAQAVLDCVGLREGRWNGSRCEGARPAPHGRRAGLAIVDTETGDVLAAAGAGAGEALSAPWPELRDFDRANPARSPLRLLALQHDGGVHHSPGSTFKVVTALGLELAARRNARIDALLGGVPPAALDRLARERGFAFGMGEASYPFGTRRAHVTNYHDEVPLRRAAAGRFGLAQALGHSVNTWFAWSSELADRSLLGQPDGGVPDLQMLDAGALDAVRPVVAMARKAGFGEALRLDGGLLPGDYRWNQWDALLASASRIDPVHSRHELRQMAIGLRMQATPLQMALVAGAVGQGRFIVPRLLLSLDGRDARSADGGPAGVRLDRIRAGMKAVVDHGTAASAFAAPDLDAIRPGLYGKTGTAPATAVDADGGRREVATVWFAGWIEPGTLPSQPHRLAAAVFVSHSAATGGAHAAPVLATLLRHWPGEAARAR